MNLDKLFGLQNKLDNRIVKDHGLEGEDLLPQKTLALQVELGELANELPEIFKFWSGKKNNYEKALVEYIDGLHFVLSIGLDSGMENTEHWFVESNIRVFQYSSLNEQFIFLFQHLSEGYQGDYAYDDLFYEFLALGEMIGFTWEQVEEAYIEKNAINHERQSNGY